MLMRLYVVRDQLAEESGPIFEAKNDLVAQRNFKQYMEKSKANFADFKLYVLGEIEHENDYVVIYPVAHVVDMYVPIELKEESNGGTDVSKGR